jgi:hypothetical protein
MPVIKSNINIDNEVIRSAMIAMLCLDWDEEKRKKFKAVSITHESADLGDFETIFKTKIEEIDKTKNKDDFWKRRMIAGACSFVFGLSQAASFGTAIEYFLAFGGALTGFELVLIILLSLAVLDSMARQTYGAIAYNDRGQKTRREKLIQLIMAESSRQNSTSEAEGCGQEASKEEIEALVLAINEACELGLENHSNSEPKLTLWQQVVCALLIAGLAVFTVWASYPIMAASMGIAASSAAGIILASMLSVSMAGLVYFLWKKGRHDGIAKFNAILNLPIGIGCYYAGFQVFMKLFIITGWISSVPAALLSVMAVSFGLASSVSSWYLTSPLLKRLLTKLEAVFSKLKDKGLTGFKNKPLASLPLAALAAIAFSYWQGMGVYIALSSWGFTASVALAFNIAITIIAGLVTFFASMALLGTDMIDHEMKNKKDFRGEAFWRIALVVVGFGLGALSTLIPSVSFVMGFVIIGSVLTAGLQIAFYHHFDHPKNRKAREARNAKPEGDSEEEVQNRLEAQAQEKNDPHSHQPDCIVGWEKQPADRYWSIFTCSIASSMVGLISGPGLAQICGLTAAAPLMLITIAWTAVCYIMFMYLFEATNLKRQKVINESFEVAVKASDPSLKENPSARFCLVWDPAGMPESRKFQVKKLEGEGLEYQGQPAKAELAAVI